MMTSIQHLLSRTGELIKHNREIEILKGEKFNIFTILQVETKENLTHSNFIAELLSPNGSHLKGSRFLELFFETVFSLKVVDFDYQKASITKEYHVGKINRDEVTGGRIDILITDGQQDILIENKVYAGDLFNQIVRYHNSKGAKSTILYLTLDGKEPSQASRAELKSGIDYHPISYKTEINNWLERCQKEAYNSPILRETIRQYQLLIQKLTGTMEQNEQQKLQGLILEKLEESELIYKNFIQAKVSVAHSFRANLINRLQQTFSKEYNISEGSPATKFTSQIWVKPITTLQEGFYFGIESFSVDHLNHHEGKLLIGSFNPGGDKTITRVEYDSNFDWFGPWWFDVLVFDDFEDTTLDFSKTNFVKKIATDHLFRERLLNYLALNVKTYLDKQKSKIVNSKKS